MRLFTPSGETLNFDSQFDTPLWTAEARLVGEGGATLRGFQVTPLTAVRGMVSDLSGKLVTEFSMAGGTLSVYDLGGPKEDPPELVPDGAEEPVSGALAAGVLAVWSGKAHGVFGFFYGSVANAEAVTAYYSHLRFTERDGVRIQSLVPRESLTAERVCIPVARVGLFTVTNARQSRSLVPRSAGRRIGPAEVWRQVHEPEPGMRQVTYVAATRTAVALFAPEWPEDHEVSDADNDSRAFGTISRITHLDWN